VPRNRGKNTTLIASMTLEGAMGPAMAVEGATDRRVFEAYVERFLAPTLSEGQIVLMDNLGAHKTERVRELVEARGAQVWFLPGYSPDLNPIEEAFSKVKALLKKAAARTKETLIEAIAEALVAATCEDARGWFVHSGYRGQGRKWLQEVLGLSVEGVRKPPKPVPEKVAKVWSEEWAKEGKEADWQRLMPPTRGFRVLARRWVVECTFAWISHTVERARTARGCVPPGRPWSTRR
jgi:transposase